MVTPVNVKRFQYVENTLRQAQLVFPCCPEIASIRGDLNIYLFFLVLSTFFKKFNFFLALMLKIYSYFFIPLREKDYAALHSCSFLRKKMPLLLILFHACVFVKYFGKFSLNPLIDRYIDRYL